LYTTRTQSALSFRSEFDSFQTSVC
jgi:hypothetical protein